MPVLIDRMESEVEIMPRAGEAERGRPAAAAAAAAGRPSSEEVRRTVVRALEEELQEYLRIRG